MVSCDPRTDPALSSLRRLNTELRTMTEAEVQRLLVQERAGLNRPAFLHRLYARFKTLREARERLEIFGQEAVAAQVECLRRMWGTSPFGEQEIREMKAVEGNPQALRDLLLQWVETRGTTHAVPPAGWLPGPQAKAMTRARILLESWVPGQTTFKEPSMIQVVKESLI